MHSPTVTSLLTSRVTSLLEAAVTPLVTIACVASLACSGDGNGGPGPQASAANIAVVSGSGQTGVITLPLANALVVVVTNSDGDPVSGFAVQWSTSSGTIPATSTTGADGRAQANWTLGNGAGGVTATAGNSALTGSTKSVSFSATALGASAAIVSGNNQTGVTRTALANPFVIELTDANNDPVQGKQVNWAVVSGGGSVDPASSVSGADGRAQTILTPGCTVGSQTANATAASFTGSPATFQASVALGGADAEVDVQDNFFSPASATICAGQTVNWTWRGNIQHNVTFDMGPNSMTQTTGTFSRTFPTAGSFAYLCTIHGTSMSGTIIVQ